MTKSFRFPMRSAVQLLVKLVFCSVFAATTAADTSDAFVDDAINELGFEAAQKVDLESGKIISVGLPDIELQPTELAVGAAMMLVRRPLAAVSDILMSEDTFRINQKILDFGAVGNASMDPQELHVVFDRVGYSGTERDETVSLLKAKPGKQFNLSQEEIEKFNSLRSVDGLTYKMISTALADMLQKRFLDYSGGGLTVVEPYVRKRGKQASPRQELTTAISSLKLVHKHFPTFYVSLSEFPAQPPEDTESQFYWVKRIADDRPAFVLTHRMLERTKDYTVAMDLQYYAQHSYNSMLTLVACVPFKDGTLIVSGVRLFTDRVTGFPSGAKKKVGRNLVAEATTQYFQDLRQVLENR